MANKITQLVNESGDNLYPLAGGMAADSINTQMLKDGAVTSDKIDWTTQTATNISFPNAHAEQGGTGPLTARKIGRIVFLTGRIQLKGYSSYTDTLSTDITNAAVLPDGFKPIQTTVLICQASGNRLVRVSIGTDGYINLARCGYLTGPGSVQVLYTDVNPTVNIHCVYLTD